jgi:predicted AAA+ superfamily ATPase
MDDIIEQIIVDFRERSFPIIRPRLEQELPWIEGKIDTVIGIRRAGKTYFVYQMLQNHLINKDVSKDKILYINFEDERLLPLTAKDLHKIPDIFYRLYPEHKNTKCYFVFDEIQNIEGWDKFVRRLLDTENVHIILTGSSAKLLSKEIATALRGRTISTEIFPYSFKEAISYENPSLNINTSFKPGSKTRAFINNRIRQYLLRGGFPEVLDLDQEYRTRILQGYVDVVTLRDVIERYQISNIQALRALIRTLLTSPASLFSVNKFYNDLKSQGLSCTKNDLYNFLEYLADAYLVYPISIFNRSERIQRTNPKKIYIVDNGLITAFSHDPHSDWGKHLENFVFLNLRRQNLTIEYYRTAHNAEVDFITTSSDGQRMLYQVALNLNDQKTRSREIQALEQAMQELKLKKSILITLEHRETILIDSGTIEVLPVAEWTLYH